MPLALSDEHRDLAASVAAWTRRAAPVAGTREHLAALGAGERPACWPALVQQGLHALHLPEEHGGGGAGLPELAVVAEQLACALHPGPWLPTVTAGAVLAGAAAQGAVPAVLEELAEGATAALVAGAGLRARPGPGGWVLEGTSEPALGVPGADLLVVRAQPDEPDEPGEAGDPGGTGEPGRWFVVRPAASVVVHPEEPTDLTRAVGRLELRAHGVPDADALTGLDPARAGLVVATLLAAEASGVARWCLETAVEHACTREQFGRPIGSFQAVQHKAAMMLVRAETICAAAWDAARAEHHDGDQQRLAAAQVGASALPAVVDLAVDCVSLLGGIGFTWEHDAHLYWRRAVSLLSAGGAQAHWEAALGTAALTAVRDFSFVDPDALPDLRAEVAGILAEVAAAPDDGRPALGWAPARGGARQARLAEAGLVAPHYPRPWGRDAGPEEQAVIAHEFARAGQVAPSTVIGEWVLPTLLVHGTAEQQERFAGPTLRGEILWCQLFSEPGAGSDLAGLSTRARKVEGGWRLSGQKVWSSMAHEADWGVCLARTDPAAPKHEGISYFLVDMSADGVDVRPLRQATGMAEFNEVFLDDVFVPDECLVAGPGDGWRLAVTTLANERLSMGARLSHGSSDRVRELLAEDGALADPADPADPVARAEALRVLGRCVGREMALSALNLRSVLARLSDLDLGAEISVQKVLNSLAQRDNSRDLLAVLGPRGLVAVPPEGQRTADPVIDHLGLPAVLFGGGTIEIQLNVIARRVLRLPR